MGISLRSICLVIWFLSFIPGAIIEFNGIHKEDWKILTIGAGLQCVAFTCLLIMTFIK